MIKVQISHFPHFHYFRGDCEETLDHVYHQTSCLLIKIQHKANLSNCDCISPDPLGPVTPYSKSNVKTHLVLFDDAFKLYKWINCVVKATFIQFKFIFSVRHFIFHVHEWIFSLFLLYIVFLDPPQSPPVNCLSLYPDVYKLDHSDPSRTGPATLYWLIITQPLML